MTYYVGNEFNLSDFLGEGNPRYFYGLRRLDDGTLFFDKVDQITSTASIAVNIPGPNTGNFENFEPIRFGRQHHYLFEGFGRLYFQRQKFRSESAVSSFALFGFQKFAGHCFGQQR